MHLLEQLAHSTVRILTEREGAGGSGTGFIIGFQAENGKAIPVLLTNRHVAEGWEDVHMVFTHSMPDKNEPEYGRRHFVHIREAPQAWVVHPSADLAGLPLWSIITEAESAGQKIYYRIMPESFIGTDEQIADLSPVQNVLMLGYPIGLADERDNLPIARRGVTATNPKMDFNGKPEFMIDCACFPGSSGSPILIYDEGPSAFGGGLAFGTRSFLLGVLWGGPQYDAKGHIRPTPIPMSQSLEVVSHVPMNLGYCIKARELRWFGEEFRRRLSAGL